jgi:hypothetical protein
MLGCLDTPAGACAARLRLLKQEIENHVRRLRFTLALSHTQGDINDRSVSPIVSLPLPLGGGMFPPLTDDEKNRATQFQQATLYTMDRIGFARLRQQLGIELTTNELKEKCHNHDLSYADACEQMEMIRRENLDHFRKSMSKISDSVIASLPLAVRFRTVPVSDEALRKELADATPCADEYVAAHPEACSAAEENIRDVGRFKLGKTVVKTGATILGMSTLCAFTTPGVCVSVWAGLSANGVSKGVYAWDVKRERLRSADGEMPDASLSVVHDKFRDMLVTIALSAVFTTKSVLGVALPTSSEAAKALESGSPFFSDAGKAFDKISGNVFDGLKGTAISQVTKESAEELVTKDRTTTYRDWVESDAFTARVFESFLGHLDR